MHRNNSAGRLLELFERAKHASGNRVTVEVWADLFGLQADPSNARDFEVARLLNLAGEQFNTLRVMASRKGMLEQFSHRINTVEQFVSVRYLGTNWDHSVQQHLNDANSAVLQMCTGFLDEEEESIPPDKLIEARKTVANLRAEVEQGHLPSMVRDFLIHQITLMERAVREYPMRGAAAFRKASNDGAAAWLDNISVVAPFAGSPEIQAVKGFWESLDKAIIRLSLYGTFAQLLWSGGQPLLQIAAENKALPAQVIKAIRPLLESHTEETTEARRLSSGSATQQQ